MLRLPQKTSATTTLRSTGIGLRTPYIKQLLKQDWGIPWLEILTDNFISQGDLHSAINPDLALLDAICERYPIALHGVNLSLGGTALLDMPYLKSVKQLSERTKALWISDHACFSHNPGYQSHDLLPLPYTAEMVVHMAQRITQVQDYLGQRILLENISSYLSYKNSDLSEAEFLSAVVEEADCLLLLDVNNVYVNYVNANSLGENATGKHYAIDNCQLTAFAQTFFQSLPLHRIQEIHLAGFADQGSYLLDAHNSPVADEVWSIYQVLLHLLEAALLPPVATLIEWDNDIPPLETLISEACTAESYCDKVYKTTNQAVAPKTSIFKQNLNLVSTQLDHQFYG